MKKTAYIHIGMPKTGTSAIQETLQRFFKEKKLKKFDMQFHHYFTWRLIHDFQVTGDKEYFIKQLHRYILRYSKKLGEKSIIISNEGFISGWDNGVFTFKYDLLPLFATALKDYNVKVVTYIRREDLLLESLTNQGVKSGLHVYNNIDISYKELFNKCVECFGQDSIIVRRYERENLYQNDAVTDFLHIIGLDDLIDDYIKHKEKKTTNSSLSPRAFRMAIADNQQYLLSESEIKMKMDNLEDRYKNGDILRRAYSILGYFCLRGRDRERFTEESRLMRVELLKGGSNFSVGSGSYGYLSPEERAEIIARNAEDNAAVAREYFGSEDGKLFNDKVPTNIININAEPTTTDIVQTFMPILIDLTQRCERLEMSPLRRFIHDCKKRFKRLK